MRCQRGEILSSFRCGLAALHRRDQNLLKNATRCALCFLALKHTQKSYELFREAQHLQPDKDAIHAYLNDKFGMEVAPLIADQIKMSHP